MEWVKVVVNIMNYPSPHEFLKSYLVAEAKIMASFDVVFNVRRGNMINIF